MVEYNSSNVNHKRHIKTIICSTNFNIKLKIQKSETSLFATYGIKNLQDHRLENQFTNFKAHYQLQESLHTMVGK